MSDYRTIYAQKWPRHRETVKMVAGKLADMGFEVSFGFGAEDKGRLGVVNPDPNEPDIFVRKGGRLLGAVEVSGSDKARVPPGDIFVRKGKMVHADSVDYETWFYMAYRGRAFALIISDVLPYRNRQTWLENEDDPYIQVPCAAGRLPEEMYAWFEGQE